MKRISGSAKTQKVLVPAACVVGPGVFAVALAGGNNALPLALLPVALGAVVALLLRRGARPLADDVFDEGDALRLRRDGVEQRVPFADISGVEHDTSRGANERIVVTFRTSGPLGEAVPFVPPAEFLGGTLSLVVELQQRAQSARRRAAGGATPG